MPGLDGSDARRRGARRAAEIGFDHRRVLQHVFGTPLGQRAAVIQHMDAIGEVGDHLAQIYERLGQKDRAIHTYALALAAPNSVPETRARLTLLLGGNSQIDSLVTQAKPEIAALRAIPAGKLLDEEAQADFFILLSPTEKNARVDAVRFVSGSERLRPLADRLRALDYGVPFPDASPLQIVRRATLSCPGQGADCTLTLVPPEDVHAVN